MRLLRKIKFYMDMMVLMVTPACREITHQLSESLDRPAPWYRKLYLRPHLLCCEYCARYLANIRLMRGVMDGYANRIEADAVEHLPALSAESRARIVALLREQDGSQK